MFDPCGISDLRHLSYHIWHTTKPVQVGEGSIENNLATFGLDECQPKATTILDSIGSVAEVSDARQSLQRVM